MHALHFEIVTFKLALDLTLGAALLFQLFCEMDKLFVFLELNAVSLASKLRSLCQNLLFLPLVSIKVPSELSDQLAVFLVIGFGLEGLVLDQELAAFLP